MPDDISSVVVLGMHRSGTSAVTRVVNLLGVPTTDPSDLLPATDENMSGYWESRRLVEFDEALLSQVSSAWATPPQPGDISALTDDDEVIEQARELLLQVGGDRACVIKDPRLCLLLPLWRRVLPAEPVVVIVNRHPVEVARSLSRRDGLSLSHGIALWEHYTRSMLQASIGSTAYVVNYDTALSELDWVEELWAVLAAQGLPVLDAAPLDGIARFLDVGQRHHAASEEDLRALCLPAQADLFHGLEGFHGAHEAFDPRPLQGGVTPWAAELLGSRRGLYVANRKLDELTRQLEEARMAWSAELESVSSELEEARAAHEQAKTEACAAHEAAERAQQVAEARARHAVEAAREEATREVQAAIAVAEGATREVQAATAVAAEARRAVEIMRASTSWRVSAPVRFLAPVRRLRRSPSSARELLRRATDYRRRSGVKETLRRARVELSQQGPESDDAYRGWVERNDTLSEHDREQIRAAILELDDPPLITVVMPTYESSPELLERAVDSVRHQCYPYWQLIIADDASQNAATVDGLRRLAQSDNRISVCRRETNGGIAAATNTALEAAEGEYVAFLDHDDELAPTALYVVADAICRQSSIDIVYSDEDKIDEHGQRYEPYFKPDYNPDLLLAQNYFNHLTVVRRSLLEKVGGLRVGFDGAQDHDLVLRLVEVTNPDRIVHLPYILYHWRQFSGSQSFSRQQAERSASAGTKAVREHLERIGASADVEVDPRALGWQRVRWELPEPPPAVTAIVPTRDQLPLLQACVEGLLHRTDYGALRVLVVDNDSTDPATLAYLDKLRGGDRTDVLEVPGPFNYSAINNRAADHVETPLMLLVNNDIEVEGPDWLAEMASLVVRDGVGAVGAKLYYGNGSVQHGGVVLGIGGVAGHAHKHSPRSSLGYFGRLILTQEVSAVTGACLLTHTHLWRSVGGLDEDHLAIAFNDVDYCLKLREAGHRIIWAANAELRHLESVSRGLEVTAQQVARFNREASWMKRRWGSVLRSDPMYNPNLTDVHEDFSLAGTPRVVKPWSAS